MDGKGNNLIIMLPEKKAQELFDNIKRISQLVEQLSANNAQKYAAAEYISAQEFMNAVNIKRTTMHALVTNNQIRTIKKKRKLYVLATEIKRYFTDPTIR